MFNYIRSLLIERTKHAKLELQEFAETETLEPPRLAFSDGIEKNRLSTMTIGELNALPFGVVQVDDAGHVLFYNTYESELANVTPQEARGKNFFKQLAPCSNSRLFYGYFKEGIVSGTLDKRFMYTFTYKMQPTLVRVHLFRDADNNNWVMIERC